MCLWIYTLRIYLQSSVLLKREKYHCTMNLSIPEVKVLLLLSYFIVVGIFSLVTFSVVLVNREPFLDDLFRYFICELTGDSPLCENIQEEFESHLHPGLYNTTFVLLALLTWVHLLYAIKLQDIKTSVQRILSSSYCCGHFKISNVKPQEHDLTFSNLRTD